MDRRSIDHRDFPSVIADLDLLLAHGYHRLGEWDLAATCQHLDRAMAASLDGRMPKGPIIFRLLAPLARRRVLGQRRIKAGVAAPSGAVYQSGSMEDADAVERYKQTISRFEAAPPFRCRHPYLGMMDREQWRQFHLIHTSHHLGFLTHRY